MTKNQVLTGIIRIISKLKLNVSIISRRIIIRKLNKLINSNYKLNNRFKLINNLLFFLLFTGIYFFNSYSSFFFIYVGKVGNVVKVSEVVKAVKVGKVVRVMEGF